MQDPQPWQVLERRYVYDRKPFMVMREDDVLLPNGATIPNYFVFEYPQWVTALAVTLEGHIILVRQYRHGIGMVHYELPAGVLEKDEEPLECAKRELMEETGYGGGDWQPWMRLSANPATHNNTCFIFLGTGVEKIGKQKLEKTEDLRVEVLPPDRVLEILRNDGIFQSLHAAPLWKYFAENQMLY